MNKQMQNGPLVPQVLLETVGIMVTHWNLSLFDRYHIYCVGLRRVPNGRWHCKECAICSSCGSKSPAGNEHLKNAEWQHEVSCVLCFIFVIYCIHNRHYFVYNFPLSNTVTYTGTHFQANGMCKIKRDIIPHHFHQFLMKSYCHTFLLVSLLRFNVHDILNTQ